MAYQKKNYSSARPSERAQNSEASTETTHYLKDKEKQYVKGISMWENEGQFGPYIKVTVSETLQPGTYYLSAKKDHASKLTA